MKPKARARLALSAALLLSTAAAALAQAPLSAIDWLRDLPAVNLPEGAAGSEDEDGEGFGIPGAELLGQSLPDGGEITVRRLDDMRIETAGLFAAARVGLSPAIWGPSTGAELTDLLRILPSDTLPALRELTYRLLLAEFVPPSPGAGDPQRAAEGFLTARVDALVAQGALEQANALLQAIEPLPAGLVRRHFDIRLLLDEDEAACAGITRYGEQRQPPRPAGTFPLPGDLADIGTPDVPTETGLDLGDEPAMPDAAPAEVLSPPGLAAPAIFCLARAGDWPGADSRLQAMIAVEPAQLSAREIDLLDRFIHFDDHADAELEPPELPARLSPMDWRLLEALGAPVVTQGLPVAFAHADLRGTAGWRAQIEAAERLVRQGALPANRLLGLYTERRAAASGGIWERVRRVQQLDQALADGNTAAIAAALLAAWPQFQDGELETTFATLFASQLMAAELTGAARSLALTIGLVSDDYELAALALETEEGPLQLRQLAAIARGLTPPEPERAASALESAVLSVFADPAPISEATLTRLADGRVGEELLRILVRMGASGDPRMLAEGLTVMRHLGLEDIARRTALQALLLERRG